MKRIKKLFLLLMFFIIALILTGCWDLRDIDRRALVVAIGIDFDETMTGSNYDYIQMVKVTAQIAIPEKLGGGAGQPLAMGEESVWNVSAVGRNVSMAFINLRRKLQFDIFIGHTRVVVISEDVAREGISRHLIYFRNHPEFRRLSYLLISENKAEELLNTFPKSANIQALYLMNLIEDEINQGTMPDMPFIESAIRRISRGIDPVSVLINSKDENIEYSGLAVFRGDRMVGKLSVEESWDFMRLAEGKIGGLEVVRDVESEFGRVSIQLTDLKRTIRPVLSEGNSFKFKVKLRFEGIILSQEVDTPYSERVLLNQLEKRICTEIEREIEELFYKVQQKYDADIFGFGEVVRAYLPGEWNKVKDWREEFKKVQLELGVETQIRRSGMHL